MKVWVRAAILPFALAATMANAQSAAQFAPQHDPRLDSNSPIRSTDDNAQYDMARVIRVVPVRGQYTQTTNTRHDGQRCYTQGGYASSGNDGYNRNGGYYGNDGYNRNNGYYGNGGYNNRGYNNGYGYPNNGYGNNGYGQSNGTGRVVAGVLGSVVGAVIGSQIGNGTGRYVGTAVGSVLGGVAGNSVYDNVQRNRQPPPQVTVCDPVPVGTDSRDNYGYGYGNDGNTWYDVTYEYRGQTYTDRLPYDPGKQLRVRVDVRPI